jgi:hypothetical protein
MNGSRNETSRRDVADNVSLSKRNRDSAMQEGNRIKQGLQELTARIVVEQDQDRFTARLKQFNQPFEEKNQRLEKPSPPKQS